MWDEQMGGTAAGPWGCGCVVTTMATTMIVTVSTEAQDDSHRVMGGDRLGAPPRGSSRVGRQSEGQRRAT